MAASLDKPLCVLNLGGVANLTWIGAGGTLLACDTGPANGPLDDWIFANGGAAYDVDGAIAAAGRVDADVLGRLMADPYFSMPAPEIPGPAAFRDHAGRKRA